MALCVLFSVNRAHLFFLVHLFIYLFFSLSHVLGSPPTPSCHPVASVLVLSVPSSTAVPVLPPSLPCDVFFIKKKRKTEKNTGKGITICQPAGILYIIYQKKKRINMKIILHKNQTETTSKSCIGCCRNDRSFYCFN